MLGVIALERRRGKARRRDEERRVGDERAVPQSPVDDVDLRERRLRVQARLAAARIGDLAAIAAVDAQEQDRRAREVQVVHRVAIGHAEGGEGRDDAVAAPGNIVEMNEIDREPCARRADEVRPALGRAAGQLERPHFAVGPVLVDAPRVADRDGEIVAARGSRCIDQRADVMLGAASVSVDHVQHAAGPARISGGPPSPSSGAVRVAPSVREAVRGPSRASSPVTDERALDVVEQAHAFGIERVRADEVLARQECHARQRQRERVAVGRDAVRRHAVHVRGHAVDRRAVGADDADQHDPARGRPASRPRRDRRRSSPCAIPAAGVSSSDWIA